MHLTNLILIIIFACRRGHLSIYMTLYIIYILYYIMYIIIYSKFTHLKHLYLLFLFFVLLSFLFQLKNQKKFRQILTDLFLEYVWKKYKIYGDRIRIYDVWIFRKNDKIFREYMLSIIWDVYTCKKCIKMIGSCVLLYVYIFISKYISPLSIFSWELLYIIVLIHLYCIQSILFTKYKYCSLHIIGKLSILE